MRSACACRPRLHIAACSPASQRLHSFHLHFALLSCCPAPCVPCCSDLMNVQLGGQLPLDAGLWSELRSLQVGGPQGGLQGNRGAGVVPSSCKHRRAQRAPVGREAQRTGAPRVRAAERA